MLLASAMSCIMTLAFPPLGDHALPHICPSTHSAAWCELLCACCVQVIVSHPANESSLDVAQQDDTKAEDRAVTSQAAGLADVLTPAAGIDKRVAAQPEAKVRHDPAAGDLLSLTNILQTLLTPIVVRYGTAFYVHGSCNQMLESGTTTCLQAAPSAESRPALGLQQVRSLAQLHPPPPPPQPGSVLQGCEGAV